MNRTTLIKKGDVNQPERIKWTRIFEIYLQFAVWVITPIVFIVFLLTYLPMTAKRNRDKAYFSSVELKEN